MTSNCDKMNFIDEFKWLGKIAPSYSVKAENVSVYIA